MSDNVDFGLGKKELRFYNPKNNERVNVRKVLKALDRGLVPSVSTILCPIRSPHIESWLLKQAMNYYLETGNYYNALSFSDGAASTFGSECHELVEFKILETYKLGGIESVVYDWETDPYYAPHIRCMEPLISWFDENVSEILFTEKKFTDVELGFGGTSDMLVKLKTGRNILLDFKFKKHSDKYPMKPSIHYPYQVSAYRKHFEKEYGKMDTMNLLVAAPSEYWDEPKLDVYDYGEDDYYEGFSACYKIWLDCYKFKEGVLSNDGK